MDLGVYVSTWNEEILIEAALKSVVKVFPQVEIIDLGSKDKTLEIVRRLNVPINSHPMPRKSAKYSFDGGPQEWIRLKNEYADKHEWILLLDGDEIFDEENLLKLKIKVESGVHEAYHIGWRMVREINGQKQVSSMIPSGLKLYKSSCYRFRRGWPGEILCSVKDKYNANHELARNCDVWCWHGVLLQRTLSVSEHTPRKKKRLGRQEYYDEELEWEDVEKWPWMT